MPNTHETLTSLFSDIADAIREKTGDTADIVADDFPAAIAEISGGDGGAYDITAVDNGDGTQTLNIVDADGAPVIEPLTVTENGTYAAEEGVDGYAPVVVNLRNQSAKAGIEHLAENQSNTLIAIGQTALGARVEVSQVASGTTLTVTMQARAGDWVLATVTTRSTTTYPSDWTLLHECASLGTDGLNQRMAFLCKQIETAEEISFAVTQSESERIYVNLIALSDIQGFAYHAGTEVRNTDIEATVDIDIQRPNYPCVIWGCTKSTWSTSAPYPAWHCDDLMPICILNTSQPRQANFIDNQQSAENRNFAASTTGMYIIDCVEVLL